jgi:nicotinate phosphoribosyltransferase
MVYKLVEYAGKMRTKLSQGKLIYPGRKQVFRTIKNGRIDHDLIGLFHKPQEGDKLLQAAMIKGKRTLLGTSGLEEDRQRSLAAQQMIPKDLLSLAKSAKPYPISFSETIQQELLRLKRISS